MRILVVEDEKKIASFVQQGTGCCGIQRAHLRAGSMTRCDLATSERFDALVLDIMLPGRDGLGVLRQLREQRNNVPVLLLTARDGLAEHVEGSERRGRRLPDEAVFDRGTDRAAARHRPAAFGRGPEPAAMRGPHVESHHARSPARGAKNRAHGARAHVAWSFCFARPGRVLTRTQIYEQVWGLSFSIPAPTSWMCASSACGAKSMTATP